MNKIKLPSGAELEINLAPFSDANALNKAIAKELGKLKLDKDADLNDPALIIELVCAAISSEEISAALWVCFKRCTYNGLKITSDTFEPEDARGDYFPICKEVLEKNCLPFVKSLLSQFGEKPTEKKA